PPAATLYPYTTLFRSSQKYNTCYTKKKIRIDWKMNRVKRLSDSIADDILSMITIEKRFFPGDKLPNEIELSEELSISRTTLRERSEEHTSELQSRFAL